MVTGLDVGRSTLREALRLLETRGVITVRPGRNGGPVVRRPRPADLAEALSLILQFENVSLADVFVARSALEPMVARLAAQKVTPGQLNVLEQTIVAMETGVQDQDAFLIQNQLFHSTIAAAAGSTVLRIFNDTLQSMADGTVVGVEYPERRRQAIIKAHQNILEGLKRGSEGAAAAAMESHIAEAGAYWAHKYSDRYRSSITWRQ
jgi:GntR family transcriptional repressor for pyruvate dehydrogenase complex